MTDKPYLHDRLTDLDIDLEPIEIVSFFLTRNYKEEPYTFAWRFNAITGYRPEITFNYQIEPRFRYEQKHFFRFAYGRFVIVLQEPQFARYAKQLARAILLVDPESLVVIDKKTGRFSGAHPQAKRIEDRIRIDQLDFFGMEMGDVVIR